MKLNLGVRYFNPKWKKSLHLFDLQAFAGVHERWCREWWPV